MSTIENAMIYSLKDNKEMAYQIDHIDGTKVRAVVCGNEIISLEFATESGWKKSSRPHKVRNKQAETIIKKCKAFIDA